MNRSIFLALALLALIPPAHATTRSTKVRNDFAKLQACPGTASNKLPCPGFIIDDKVAIDCGGKDEVANKQWLTVAAAKAKDKTERNGPECKHRTHGVMP
jgi:hypothetical protein